MNVQKTIQIEVSETIKKELEKIPSWKLMFYLQENGETPAYSLAKELNWSTGKIHSLIKKLEKSRAVRTSTKIVNGRAVKFVKLIS